jgi:hypothetical protein
VGDVKLTREGLRAALDEWAGPYDGEVLFTEGAALTLLAAARALLAATEPASDEEIRNAAGISGALTGLDLYTSRVYRAAEARARRLAGLGEEG